MKRLNEKERKQLHLLEAALSVSVYTGNIYILEFIFKKFFQ